MRSPSMTYEKVSTFSRLDRTDTRPGPQPGTARVAGGALGSGPNGAGRIAYANARLRKVDEARSAELAADPRVYAADEDEMTTRPCGARRVP